MHSWLLIGQLILVTEVSWMQLGLSYTRDSKTERTQNDDFGTKLSTKINYHFISF